MTSTPPDANAAKKPTWWAETKGDLKWASVLLIGALVAGPTVLFLAAPVFAPILAFFGIGPPGDPWLAWSAPAAGEENIADMTDAIFSQKGLLVPFEILSVLLLAALIAGVVIAFRDPEGGI
jgi:NADH:ubiquinone oxidoreductase subunit 6 (subunit J)